MKLINDLITQLIDPNIFYSRFSFFESGRDAIEIKYAVSVLAVANCLKPVESTLCRSRVYSQQVLHALCPSLTVDTQSVGRKDQSTLWHR